MNRHQADGLLLQSNTKEQKGGAACSVRCAAFSVLYPSLIYTALNCVWPKEAERPKLLTGVQRGEASRQCCVCRGGTQAPGGIGQLCTLLCSEVD